MIGISDSTYLRRRLPLPTEQKLWIDILESLSVPFLRLPLFSCCRRIIDSHWWSTLVDSQRSSNPMLTSKIMLYDLQNSIDGVCRSYMPKALHRISKSR